MNQLSWYFVSESEKIHEVRFSRRKLKSGFGLVMKDCLQLIDMAVTRSLSLTNAKYITQLLAHKSPVVSCVFSVIQ